MKIALVTYKAEPQLTASDSLLRKALINLGVSATAQPWDDASTDWSKFDTVILRSCWDYHERPEEFSEWIKRRQAEGTSLWNPPAMVLGNMHKKYLLDLEKQGVKIVPTVMLGRGRAVDVSALKHAGWDEIVAKPAIGASAYKIFKGSLDDPGIVAKLSDLASLQDCLVQPLMREVVELGEYSSIFFNGSYSHTVLKRPKGGDFRSNYEQGGSSELTEQDGKVLNSLQAIFQKINPSPLYARVDYLLKDGEPLLMELELIEPSLYMDLYPKAANTFAAAILSV